MRHRKLARSGGTPGCLQACQEEDQSVAGLDSSALQGINFCCPVSLSSSIVMNSSVRNLTQSFSFIVIIFRGQKFLRSRGGREGLLAVFFSNVPSQKLGRKARRSVRQPRLPDQERIG